MAVSSQITNTVLLVSPDHFGFNIETASTNVFQHDLHIQREELQAKAKEEFNSMVAILKNAHINVITIKSPEKEVPDAVFPNNWLSTDSDGNMIVYSMMSPLRRLEKQYEPVAKILTSSGFHVKRIINFDNFEKADIFLEGTGSMTLDRVHKKAYASLSSRTDMRALEYFSSAFAYKPIYFRSFDLNKKEIYHTNMMMNMGEGFAVVCLDSIIDQNARKIVADELIKDGMEIIEISQEQVFTYCGNLLQVRSMHGEKNIIISENAFGHLKQEQKEQLEKQGKIIIVPLPTIETVAGGSARCMMAEIFLPRIH
jgi:hypothetical protein